MSESIQAVRGINDLLPGEAAAWQRLETVARETFAAYGYREMRVPLLERTELFKRSIGEFTDIVEKEMYTFADRNGDSLDAASRSAPPGSCARRLSNGLLHNQRQKIWTQGPMFRYERPQKGRYRQFHQIEVEALGYAGSGRRCRTDHDVRAHLASARPPWPAAAPELARHAGIAAHLPRGTGRLPARARSGAGRGQPPASRRQPAARAGQQESRDGGDRRGGAVAGRLPR